jgi:hypothetical protein
MQVVIWDSIIAKYDQELKLPLLTEATKLLMPTSVEENEDLQSKGNVKDFIQTTSKNANIYKDLMSKELIVVNILLMLKIANVPYFGGIKKKQVSNPCYISMTYTWHPSQPNRDITHFFYCWHFDCTLEMFSNKKMDKLIFVHNI